MTEARTWSGTIEGEPASKANSRRLVRLRGRLVPIKSAKAIAYERSVAAQIAPLPYDQRLRGALAMHCRIYYASERPDLDPSLILDGLQGRIYDNDRQVREMHLHHHIDRARPRAEIYLTELRDNAAAT